jgi:DMSO/TMAO reductase YedYZ molybdopterin-dependent catalytic subunit
VSIVEFTGTPLSSLLEELGIRGSSNEVVFVGSDKGKVSQGREVFYTRSLPVKVAISPDIILAWEMNGEPLSPEHGFPLRLVVPGWYGMASVKWLNEIKFVEEPFKGFFQNEHYVYTEEEGTAEGEPVRQIRVRSLIHKPETGTEFERELIEISGVAYSGEGEISKVELSFNAGKSWEPARLEELSSAYTAQRWSIAWLPDQPGVYNIFSRATDVAGNSQPLEQRWNRLGYGNNGVQKVIITIK